MADAAAPLIRTLSKESLQPVYLVHGDLVLARPAAQRLANAVAQLVAADAGQVEEHRRPARLGSLLADLRTYSLFGGAKVLLVVGSAALADKAGAALLIDEAAEVLPLADVDGDRELNSRERLAASRLVQALHLFDLDPQAHDAPTLLAELPDWALQGAKSGKGGKKKGRTKKQIGALREDLAALLEAARRADLTGFAEGEVAELADIVRQGLPEGHCLVLAEATAAKDHPVVQLLRERKAVIEVGEVASGKQGWSGLDPIAEELGRETGVAIARDALQELARRTLRETGWGSNKTIEADSTARLAGEYRKLASLVPGGRIDRALVEANVLDRGQEDSWEILDAIGAGRAQDAVVRLRRMLHSAQDPMAARLSFFALLCGFCRHLTAVRGMMRLKRVSAGERNYNRFKTQVAPQLQAALPAGDNPITRLHPFRLHKAYLAACRLPEPLVAELPWQVLQTELLLKGESTDADGALASLVTRLAA